MNITTKFSYQEDAYILKEARRGKLIKGPVERIKVQVGFNGNSAPEIFYAVKVNSVIAPPGGLFAEFELATAEEAKAEAREYHRVQQSFHGKQADDLA